MQDNPGDNALIEQYSRAAQQYQDRYSFGVGTLSPLSVLIACYNNINGEQLSVADLTAGGSLDRFIKQCSRPLIPEFTVKNEHECLTVSQVSVDILFEKLSNDRWAKAWCITFTAAKRSASNT